MVWKTKIVNQLSLVEIFTGAFLSTILTCISFGCFLRLGSILFLSGLELLALVCLFAILICCVTAFSISWMLSNIKAENDSLHFLLSRTFGVDVAFSVSLPLFISQALSAAFYILGISEVLSTLFPWFNIKALVWCLFLLFGCLAFLKYDFLLKGEIILFTLVIGTLITIFFNPLLQPSFEVQKKTYLGFWECFALFFPLITGLESSFGGCNSKQFSAKIYALGINFGLITSAIFYLAMMYFLHLYVDLDVLKKDTLAVQHLSTLPLLCLITIIGSGFLATINSISSGSQTLKSLIENAPVLAVFKQKSFTLFFTLCIIALGLYFGSINTISPFLTLFFLFSYGMINMATGLEAWIGNPSWRPLLKGHYLISICGALICFITILMISPGFSLISSILILSLYLLIKKIKITTSWDDFRYSISLFIARSFIYKLNHLLPSPKTWRPNLLVFIGDPLLRTHLTQLSCDLTHKKGFLIFSSIVSDEATSLYEGKKLNLFLEKKEIPALVKVKTASCLLEGMLSLIENIGLGSLSPNTIVLGASEKEEKTFLLSELIIFIHQSKKNLVLIKESSSKAPVACQNIHLWWGAKNRINSELMIIYSHMLKKSSTWKNAKIILKTVVNSADEIAPTQQKLLAFIQQSRIFFDTSVILHTHGDIFSQTMQEHSSTADLVFLGLKPPETHETIESYAKYYKSLMEKTKGFPAIAFILAGEPLDFEKILF